ncbi:MAG: hypothetical protein AAFO81_03710 [Pseudomonadota bacterium]
MFSSKATDQLAFVSRQLSGLLVDEPVEPALQRLSKASPPQYARDIEYLRSLLSGSTHRVERYGRNPYRTLAKLLPAATHAKSELFRNFIAYVQQNKLILDAYWSGVFGIVAYFAWLVVVAIQVTAIFGVFVLPGMQQMYANFGERLPQLTATLFASGGFGVPLLVVVLAVFLVLAVWFVVLFRRRINAVAPLPRWLAWLPFMGTVTKTYNLNLFLNFTRALIDSRVETRQAVDLAAAASNQPVSLNIGSLAAGDFGAASDPALTELSIAARLNRFEQEVEFQCEQHSHRLSAALIRTRDRFSLVLKFILYVFIGTLVVAMYLPIFKMGTVL